MILTDLLDSRVIDHTGRRLGYVIDVRFLVGDPDGSGRSTARLDSFIMSPHTRTSFMGYERSKAVAPVFIAAYLAWRHRGSQLVEWSDVTWMEPGEIRLRRGYRPSSPTDGIDE